MLEMSRLRMDSTAASVASLHESDSEFAVELGENGVS